MGTWKRIRALWRTLGRLILTGLRFLRGAPLVGEIRGRFLVEPAVIEDDEFGCSSRNPQVLEIIVSDEEQWPLGVGKIVNEVFFDEDPPIVFNVCFSCHQPDEDGRSEYADPESHWFNVFFGFYEIDVPSAEWGRPFGFKSADPDRLEIEFRDLVRIGKSDWNYFSNYIYGVPWWEVSKHNRLDDPGTTTRVADRPEEVAGQRFLECEVDGMEVVSAYCAGDERLRRNVWPFTRVWRKQFGTCEPRPGHDLSFVPTRMKLRFLIRWEEGEDYDLECRAYKTFIYGGSINKGFRDPAFNERFLEAQMEAVKKAAFRKLPR